MNRILLLQRLALIAGSATLAMALPPPAAHAGAAPPSAAGTAGKGGTEKAAAAEADAARDREKRIRLARDVESFGTATRSPDALLLAARMWHELGATPDRNRALDRATDSSGGDARLLTAIRALRSAESKGVTMAPPISIAPGEQADTRGWVPSGSARARVTSSLPAQLRLVVTDGKGTELCAATGGGGGVECAWTAPWDGDVVLSVQNLGTERLSAWTIMRSADNNAGQDEGTVTWR